MKISDAGLLEICEHEGIVPAPYFDSTGVWTFGVGHTAGAGEPNPAKMPRGMPTDLDSVILDALELFRDDLAKYEARVTGAIRVPLVQHEFDALVSFDLNTGGIFRARLTQRFNAGDPDAASSFMGWLKPPEIRGRREDEMALFRTGNYEANGNLIPVYKVDGNGRLRGVIKTVSGNDVLRLLHRTTAPMPDVEPIRPDEIPQPAGFIFYLLKLFGGLSK